MATNLSLAKYRHCVDTACTIQAKGKVTDVVGLVIEAQGPVSKLGTVCDIYTKGDCDKITAEVMGFKDSKVLLFFCNLLLLWLPRCTAIAARQRVHPGR